MDFPVETWTRLFDRSGAETAFYRSSESHLDAQGNREETAFKPDGTIENRFVHHHDDAGRETEEVLLLSDGRPHGRWVSSYDASGRLAGRVWHNREGVAEVAETFEYNAAGRLIRKVRGNVASWTYEHDGEGRVVRARGGYYSSDELDDEQLDYDARGRLAQKTRFHPGGQVRSITTLHYGDEP